MYIRGLPRKNKSRHTNTVENEVPEAPRESIDHEGFAYLRLKKLAVRPYFEVNESSMRRCVRMTSYLMRGLKTKLAFLLSQYRVLALVILVDVSNPRTAVGLGGQSTKPLF